MEPLPTDPTWDLSDWLKLKVSGPDRIRWLNGQISQDVRKATANPGQAYWSCVCNHKGKLDGILTVHATEDALWISAPPELAETLPMRLERYIIADDVLLEDVTADFRLLHFSIPPDRTDNSLVRISRHGHWGHDLWLPKDSTETFEIAAQAFLNEVRVLSSVPAWDRELSGDVLPSEAHLDTFAVDFHKGCYTGQEVVSRMKTAGRTNRSLVTVELELHEYMFGRAFPLPTELFSETGERVGTLTSWTRFKGLAWLQKGGFGAKHVFAEGVKLSVNERGAAFWASGGKND